VSPPSRVDLLLAQARSRLGRLTPEQARRATDAGAVVVDIRPAAQRAQHGALAGALVIERNVLEWRLDSTSEAALPIADDDLQVVVLCQEGYTSSLAAAALLDVGVRHATDVIGGFAAWIADGVPAPANHQHPCSTGTDLVERTHHCCETHLETDR
jgi:rhodanese-related sulfurtransferase